MNEDGSITPLKVPPVKLVKKSDHNMELRSGTITGNSGWSICNPFNPPESPKATQMGETETYPMNPGEGAGARPVMYVYRPWTADDVKKAAEGIPHPKDNVIRWEEGIRGLHESYSLNGLEAERAVRQSTSTRRSESSPAVQ